MGDLNSNIKWIFSRGLENKTKISKDAYQYGNYISLSPSLLFSSIFAWRHAYLGNVLGYSRIQISAGGCGSSSSCRAGGFACEKAVSKRS
jgi:hypothetical protein